MQWKKKKMKERDAGLAAQMAERAKNDRMRYVSAPPCMGLCVLLRADTLFIRF